MNNGIIAGCDETTELLISAETLNDAIIAIMVCIFLSKIYANERFNLVRIVLFVVFTHLITIGLFFIKEQTHCDKKLYQLSNVIKKIYYSKIVLSMIFIVSVKYYNNTLQRITSYTYVLV